MKMIIDIICKIAMAIEAVLSPIICAGLNFADEHAIGCFMVVIVIGVMSGALFGRVWKVIVE